MKSSPDLVHAPERGTAHGRPRAVLFDLDGTLVDTGPDIAAAVNLMLADMGHATHPVEEILNWVGEGTPRLVQRALSGGMDGRPPDRDLEHSLALFREHYAAGICVQSEPYPHARTVLERLRASGTRTGCVTNKPAHLTHLLLDALALSAMFDVIVCGDTLAVAKPHPEPIRHACRELGLEPASAVYVGDSMTDCRAAEAAGVPMIVVTYGYNQGADLTKAPCAAIIDDLGALPEALRDPESTLTRQ